MNNKEDNALSAEIKKPSERTTEDLLELVCQLSGRLAMYNNKVMFDAYWEARNEMDKRVAQFQLNPLPQSNGAGEGVIHLGHYEYDFENETSKFVPANEEAPAIDNVSEDALRDCFNAGVLRGCQERQDALGGTRLGKRFPDFEGWLSLHKQDIIHPITDEAIEAEKKMNLFIDKYIAECGYGMDMWSKEENSAITRVIKILFSIDTEKT